MMFKRLATGIGFSLILATIINAPAAYCDGVIAASSEASCTAGFPVLTGPGATVLTPSGAYTMGFDGPPMQNIYNPVQKDYSTPVAASKVDNHKVEAQVKYYTWPSSGKSKTTGVAYRNYVSNKRVAMFAGDHFSSQ